MQIKSCFIFRVELAVSRPQLNFAFIVVMMDSCIKHLETASCWYLVLTQKSRRKLHAVHWALCMPQLNRGKPCTISYMHYLCSNFINSNNIKWVIQMDSGFRLVVWYWYQYVEFLICTKLSYDLRVCGKTDMLPSSTGTSLLVHNIGWRQDFNLRNARFDHHGGGRTRWRKKMRKPTMINTSADVVADKEWRKQ